MPIPTVVIVGLGPGGLTAAIEAAQKGYHVVALEQRRCLPEMMITLARIFLSFSGKTRLDCRQLRCRATPSCH